MWRYSICLAAALVLAACSSDDGGEGTEDAGVSDSGAPDTVGSPEQGPDVGVAFQDGAPEEQRDQGVDQTVLNVSEWTEVMAAPGRLYDLWGSDASHVFAVGAGGLILSWDGTQWSQMATPNALDLHAITGNEMGMIAVGDGGDVVWDGTEWLEGYTGSTYAFEDVTIADSYLFTVSDTRVIRRSGTSTSGYWSSTYLDSKVDGLHAVWAVSDNEVYAAGDNGVVLKCQSQCTTYSATWKPMEMPEGVDGHLQAIHRFPSGEMFVVGLAGTVLYHDGSSWTVMQLNTDSYFYGVWGTSPTDVWVVGYPMFQPRESVFHYDGSSWTLSRLPRDNTKLNAVWAVGPTAILRYKKDAPPDAGGDAGADAGLDAEPDANADAGSDAGPDANADAGPDANADAGP